MPAATRRSQQGCWLSILSWSATPGSPASRKWLRWCFVRKRLVEIQYFRTVISDEQREEFGHLVQDSIRRIEAADFRTQWDPLSPEPLQQLSYVGLCLGRQELTDAAWCGVQEQKTLVGLTSLRTRVSADAAQAQPKRALFVLTKIDEILAWDSEGRRRSGTPEFVELGRYLCEVRAGQYWRLEKLKSFDEFLARRFPESQTEGVLPHVDPRAPAAAG